MYYNIQINFTVGQLVYFCYVSDIPHWSHWSDFVKKDNQNNKQEKYLQLTIRKKKFRKKGTALQDFERSSLEITLGQ